MTLACKNALLAPGPAHLIFPDEVQTLPAGDEKPGGPEGRIAPAAIAPPAESLDAALARDAGRPSGRSSSSATARAFRWTPIVELAERLGAPVITTFKAKGQIPESHPLAAGVLGRSGTPVASWFMNESDLILVFGASFSNHTGIYAGKPIIQVDSDPLQLGKFHPVAVPVWGDAAVTARLLLDGLPDDPGTEDQTAQLRERWAIWRAEKASRALDDRGHGVASAAVFAAMNRLTPDDAVIAVDVGNHAYSFGRYFEPERQTVLMSGYLGSIGFGYPAAIGAAVAAPERKTVAVTGDGGFAQYMAEVTTAVKHDLDITHVLLNNGQLGKISKEQRAGEWDVWQTSLHNPDFAAFARNCGAHGVRVTDAARARRRARRRPSRTTDPAMVEVMTDPELI